MKVLKDKIKEAIEYTLRKNNLFPETAHLLVAYSSGADSTCLAHALHKIGYKVAIAHANFQLRGSESEADAKFASEFAEKLGLTYHERTFNTKNFQQEQKLSIQESARQLRYDWFEELRIAHSYHVIITAHHADDQAETMFFNFMRGAGISGLRGIPKVNGNIIRPLLDISKKEILDYLHKNKLTYREDSSNSETHYSRNFIRHEIFPLCEKIQPHFSETFLRSNQIYAETERWLQFSTKKMLEHLYSIHGVVHKLNLNEARYWPGIHTAIYEWMKPLGFNSDVCSSISEAIIQGRNGRTFLSEHCEAMTFRHELHWVERKIMQTIKETTILLEHGKSFEIPGMNIQYSNNITPNTKNTLCISMKQNHQEITLRSWRSGDQFKPKGMRGKSKKVSDFLNDIGWSPLQKKTCWLVCKENTIILIPGLRGSIYQIEQTEPAVGCWHFEYAHNI
jgi:tRNA(Ile)-lysidine synthase